MAAKSMTGEIYAIKNGEGLKETAASFPVNCKWQRADGVKNRRCEEQTPIHYQETRDRENELKKRTIMNYSHV
jgi:uncharacterized protein YodC (DUF2158 family)